MLSLLNSFKAEAIDSSEEQAVDISQKVSAGNIIIAKSTDHFFVNHTPERKGSGRLTAGADNTSDPPVYPYITTKNTRLGYLLFGIAIGYTTETDPLLAHECVLLIQEQIFRRQYMYRNIFHHQEYVSVEEVLTLMLCTANFDKLIIECIKIPP